MPINLRRIHTAHRDLLRATGADLRRLRDDAGLSQAMVAAAAGISSSHLSYIEAGLREPSVEVLLRLGAVLGADLSIRYFPNTGPVLRDHLQAAMGQGFLPALAPCWRSAPEVAVYRPVRGVIDLVLEHRREPDTIATELQSQLRRAEQQVRWSNQKADALAALPDQRGRRVSRLLILRNSRAMRDAVAATDAVLAAAYPARTADAVAALRGEGPWPGSAMAWMRIDRGVATLLDGPPRGVAPGC
ncbi:MAG TPA: helix-turn-helix transcriptional regulator [Candidatus Limnocylindrales bacterium]|nr:helix-turn-helix transcriptional regulator [Candidatus Limnocylindrales bacterium]